jgi:signal transduction histidine kinase
VSIEVVDEGGGIAPELREHLFEPFFTTKRTAEGTGRGLALVYSIVSDHGGTIAIDSHPGHGTRVRVHLPLMRERHDDLMQST